MLTLTEFGREPGVAGPKDKAVILNSVTPSDTRTAVTKPVVESTFTIIFPFVIKRGLGGAGCCCFGCGTSSGENGGSTMAPPGGATRTRTALSPHGSSCTRIEGAADAEIARTLANRRASENLIVTTASRRNNISDAVASSYARVRHLARTLINI